MWNKRITSGCSVGDSHRRAEQLTMKNVRHLWCFEYTSMMLANQTSQTHSLIIISRVAYCFHGDALLKYWFSDSEWWVCLSILHTVRNMKWGEHAGTYAVPHHHDDRPQIHRLYLHYFMLSACTPHTPTKAGTHTEGRNQTLNKRTAGRQISPSSPHCNRRSICCHTLWTSALRILPAHTADKPANLKSLCWNPGKIHPHYVRPLCFLHLVSVRIKLSSLHSGDTEALACPSVQMSSYLWLVKEIKV